jgi:drug/metabolite transporter (DMT)-like permease
MTIGTTGIFINIMALIFGFIMATVDVVSFSILKCISMGTFKNSLWLVTAVLMYACQPLIFLTSLSYEGITVMNLLWNMSSNILVTSIGLFWFKERLSNLKIWGVIFAFLSLILLATE